MIGHNRKEQTPKTYPETWFTGLGLFFFLHECRIHMAFYELTMETLNTA